MELLIVVVGAFLSRIFSFKENYLVKTIDDIPSGFPEAKVPSFDLAQELILDGFVIAVVSYSVSVSMALILAQRSNYEIDFNQELLAMVCYHSFSTSSTINKQHTILIRLVP